MEPSLSQYFENSQQVLIASILTALNTHMALFKKMDGNFVAKTLENLVSMGIPTTLLLDMCINNAFEFIWGQCSNLLTEYWLTKSQAEELWVII
jgi:hypothetical protein